MLRETLFAILGLVFLTQAAHSIPPREIVYPAQMENPRQLGGVVNTLANLGHVGVDALASIGQAGVNVATNVLSTALYGAGGTGADYIGSYSQLAGYYISQNPIQTTVPLPSGYQAFQEYNTLGPQVGYPVSTYYQVVCDTVYTYNCYYYYYNPVGYGGY